MRNIDPRDLQAWRTIDEKFPEIAKDLRNLRLGISADGVDINSGTRHHSDTQEMISVFFRIVSWWSAYLNRDRVDIYDASTKENFHPCAIMLWMINVFPVLDTLCGCPDSRFKEKNVCESLVGTLLNVPGKTKDGMNARLDLTEKEISLQELDKLQLELVVTLCLVEKFFPLSFFDIMIHLTMHLTREVERKLEISKDSVSETVSEVSVEAVDLHISKEIATIRKAFYYEVLQEIWVLDYRFRKIPLFKCDWINHKLGGVKHDPNLGYTLVDLNSLGHKDDPFILASQA
uniref:DUF4218 domain-containing protein n=1 Tax=Tanacetum cinerariifolium TaxID=118510 RepID=A0A699HCU4_TANCI|nr:hypothetical protein [Tanacetum cinerariifolium]